MRCVKGDARTSPTAQSRHSASSGGVPKDQASPTASITEAAQSCQVIPRGSIIPASLDRGEANTRDVSPPRDALPPQPRDWRNSPTNVADRPLVYAPSKLYPESGSTRHSRRRCCSGSSCDFFGSQRYLQPAGLKSCCLRGRRLCGLFDLRARPRGAKATPVGGFDRECRLSW